MTAVNPAQLVNIAVEGESDREAAKAVVRAAGRKVDKVRVAGGKSRLDPKIAKYNQAAARANWVVFRDSDGQCPVQLRQQLVSDIAPTNPRFSLRVAHSMTEAWLLADIAGFAEFFKVKAVKLVRDPESLTHAKNFVLNLCAKSTSNVIRVSMVTSDLKTGPLYAQGINDFASIAWDVHAAAQVSPSLARAIVDIRRMPLL